MSDLPAVELVKGSCTTTAIGFAITAKHAEQIVYRVEPVAGDPETPSAEELFQTGIVLEAPATTTSHTAEGLQPQTVYRVFAAASNKAGYSTVAQLDLMTVTEPDRPLLSFVEATKTSFSYRLDAELDTHIFHTYLEKWAYDELWAAFSAQFSDNPDRSHFVQYVLAEFGLEVLGPQTVTWNAGDENLPREGFASITGGKSYYALAALADPERGEWVGTAEAVEFTVPDPDRSTATVEIELLDLQPELLRSCITPDEHIRFYFYHLFKKEVVDEYIQQFGQAAFENHIYEYGYCSDGPYTDLWRMEPGTEYLIAVFGIDAEGDVMYTDKAFRAPVHLPKVVVNLQPYENELQGYYAYENLELFAGFENFGDLSHEYATWTLTSRELVNEALAMMGEGATLEACIEQGFIYMMPLAYEWLEQIGQTGTFTHIFEQVEPQTEYLFLLATYDADGKMILGQGEAITPAQPGEGPADPEYLGYLGRWRLEGKSTEDWASPIAYDLTIEELTPNRSFLVRGWSNSSVGQDFPFVMNYDPATKKASVNGPQYLGTSQIGGTSCEVVFAGMFIYGMVDDLTIYIAPTYRAYEVRLDENRLRFFPEMFDFDNNVHSFASLGYNARTEEGFRTFEGDEHNVISFLVTRAQESVAEAPSFRYMRVQSPSQTTAHGSGFPAQSAGQGSLSPAAAEMLPVKMPAVPGERPLLRRR